MESTLVNWPVVIVVVVQVFLVWLPLRARDRRLGRILGSRPRSSWVNSYCDVDADGSALRVQFADAITTAATTSLEVAVGRGDA